MTISSPEFGSNQPIPAKYSEQADNKKSINPPLNFSNIPENAKSLCLIVDDPDAPGGTFVHWLLWNINPNKTEILEGECKNLKPSGLNGYKKVGYSGPNPPNQEEHRYFFRLYALDTKLSLKNGSTHEDLNLAMGGHILAETNFFGVYKKPNPN